MTDLTHRLLSARAAAPDPKLLQDAVERIEAQAAELARLRNVVARLSEDRAGGPSGMAGRGA
jgi:hypothetical protein